MSNSVKSCSVGGCDKPHNAKGYCRRHYKRFAKTGSTNPRDCLTCGCELAGKGSGRRAYCDACHPKCAVASCQQPTRGTDTVCYGHYRQENRSDRPICPTCGNEINRGPGQHTYCSEACRPNCEVASCDRPTRGTSPWCATHVAQMQTTGLLKPVRWAAERLCLVCGKETTLKDYRRYCGPSCKKLWLKHGGQRPESFDCARCGIAVSLLDFSLTKSGYRKRSDSRLCPKCKKKRSRWALSPEQLVARDGSECGICGYYVYLDATGELKPSVDHIIPRPGGGSDDPSNLQLAHLWCNQIKNGRLGKPEALGPARLRYIAERVMSYG